MALITPTNATVTSSYDGNPADIVALRLATGNKWFERGLIYMSQRQSTKLHIPRHVLSNIIQARAATPTSQGSGTLDEKTAELDEMMIYYEFNPRDFEALWPFIQPNGELLFREMNPIALEALLTEVANHGNTYLERNIAVGDKGGSAPDNIFDGIITQLNADGDTPQVGSPVAVTSTNVFAQMEALVDAAPVAVQDNPNSKIIVPYAIGKAYQRADHSQTYKGQSRSEGMGMLEFEGYEIVPMAGMRANTMLFTHCGPDMSSNLWGAIDNSMNTLHTIQVDRLQNNSELHFVKMNVKVGFSYKFAEEAALYYVP